MSRFFGIGPIRLSNLVNSAILQFPRGFSTYGYHTNALPSDAVAVNGVEGGGARWFCVEVGGGCESKKQGSYQTFNIIMVHYSSDSSLCAAASYT